MATATLTRRDVLQALAAAPLMFGLPSDASTAAAQVRYDAASPEGLQMLEIYAGVVRSMQALGSRNPMGWLWQWYTHFVSGATTKSAELTRIFGSTASTQKSFANDTWDTCQSHSGQNANHFLPWHRMYVYYFERIVRNVSGRADFTLPYWDYTSSDPAKRAILPLQFRLPNDPLFGVLYRPERNALANGGERIDQNQPADMMGIDDAMAKASYSTVGTVTGFCRAIDSGIHGRIHTLVGTSKGMGAVPYAGRDPLFWVHHANIDRMWASWNQNGGSNPASASWAYDQFVFADAGGVRVKKPLRNFFSVADLGYGYDTLIAKPAVTYSSAVTSTALASTDVVASADSTELGSAPQPVLLRGVGSLQGASVLGLDPAHPGKRTYLVLRDLHTWTQPEVLFHLYLSPGQARPLLDRAHYVGNINFFDAQFHEHGGGSALDMALGGNLYSFDVTALLESLAREAGTQARDALLLTVVPGGRPAGGRPMIGTIELVRQ